jgi:hypothetical protein
MEINGLIIANKAQRQFLASALPNAPVVDDGRSPEALARRPRLRRSMVRTLRQRRSMARTLRRTADRLEAKPRWAIN